MASEIRTFTNVRARILRCQDNVWMAGWVTHLARDEARIRQCAFLSMTANEMIRGECYGQGTVARFQGRLIAQSGQDLAIVIQGSIFYGPSSETPRVVTTGLMGSLMAPDRNSSMMVLDISPDSLGVLVECGFTPGSDLTLNLPTEMGPIEGRVTVANCRADVANEDHFRVGLHISGMDRLDRARWSRLVNERAGA